MNIWKDEVKKMKEKIGNSVTGRLSGPLIVLSAGVLAFAVLFDADVSLKTRPWLSASFTERSIGDFSGDAYIELEEKIMPQEGVVLPVVWGDLGRKLISSGTIDEVNFTGLYEGRGGLSNEERDLLYGDKNGKLRITRENSGFLLNLLWAFGLGNNNEILTSGEMVDPLYGGAGNFASTGGWTLARGSAMDHYAKHSFVTLTSEEQSLVDKVSRNIYRPCCGNSTHFPDCNHGMAMLGLLELMAAQGASERDMYKAALAVNSYWFPDTYFSIGRYLLNEGRDISSVDPKEILGAEYSSAAGYRRILSAIQPASNLGGGGCGI